MAYDNDEHTLDIEKLGNKKQIETIRELILEANTPYSLAISGRWGSGKTSAMKHLYASLGGKPSKHNLSFGSVEIENEKNLMKFMKNMTMLKISIQFGFTLGKMKIIKNLWLVYFKRFIIISLLYKKV